MFSTMTKVFSEAASRGISVPDKTPFLQAAAARWAAFQALVARAQSRFQGVFPVPAVKTLFFVFASFLAVPSLTCAQSEKLGLPAPALQATNVMSDEPVDWKRADTNRVHVLVFWETWCSSCMASLPVLADLQTKLKPRGVELLGISPETAEAVKGFLTNNEVGAKINFPLACDPERKTFDAYMTAFGQGQVPRAFVVDKGGALVWYGHPLAGMEFVLEQVLAGKFDLAAAKKTLAAEALQKDYFLQAKTNSGAAEVRQLGRKIATDGAANPWLLNNFAWLILQSYPVDNRDLALALQASKSACESTDWQRPTFLDTHALAVFSNGDAPGAVRLEKKALALCTNETLRVRLEQSLKTFEAGYTNLVLEAAEKTVPGN